MAMTLRGFLLHETKSKELCVICDPWICATVWIDHEDLFIRGVKEDLLKSAVSKDEWKDFYVCDEKGQTQTIKAHYIYI